MLPIHFRGYQAKDLDALEALDAVCFTPPFRFSRPMMRRSAEARNALVRLAHETSPEGAEGCLVGFCIVHLGRGSGVRKLGYVVTLDVDPRRRGEGLARHLMHSLEGLAQEQGALAMTLHVSVGNEPAIRLYERLGYVRVRVEVQFYGEGGDAFLYRKPLSFGVHPLDAA